MNKQYQPVRGPHDLVGDAMLRHLHIADVARIVTARYGASEIATPVFEFTEVFHRTLGDTSDVVSKETYTFEDRGGESLTLRPEFTASVVRAFISGGFTQQLPFKAFYTGRAFRYERPQKGRQRQFHQVGLEVLGADSPLDDVEVIATAYHLLQALGLAQGCVLELNSLGDSASRTQYRETLVAYLNQHKASLSPESQERLEKNPLRILDSKQEADKVIVAGAPALADSFTPEATAWFAAVKAGLDALGIAYNVSPRLVRGLDYYTHTVFEFTSDALGAQATALAGGRYDGLVELMGGSAVAGIGWAAGMERLALMMEAVGTPLPEVVPPVVIMPMEEAEQMAGLKLAHDLRAQGFTVEMLLKGNLGKRFKKADKAQATFAIIIGENELAAGEVTLKNLKSGEQQQIKITEVANVIGR
jgi:histidyl-tRNA synthetase